MKRLREFIRRFARKDNWFGFSCSVIVYFFRKSPKAAGKLIAERHCRNRERRIAFKMIQLPAEELRLQKEASATESVLFSVITPLYNTPIPFLREMIESVLSQTYPHWELCLADGSDETHQEVETICREYAGQDSRIRYSRLLRNEGISANTNACLQMASGSYLALLDHDDLFLPNALYECTQAIYQTNADFVYSDEYVFVSPSVKNILNTHFKPDFSPESLLTNNYICHLSVFKRTLLDKAGWFRKEYDGSQDHDLILRLTDCAETITHIPKPLYLWRSHSSSVASDISVKSYAIDAGRGAVRAFLESKGIQAEVESVASCPTMYHVVYPIQGNPSVCVILDLVDSGKSAESVQEQVRNLKAFSDYDNIQFAIIVSQDAASRQSTPDVQWFSSSETNRPKRLNGIIKTVDSDYLVILDPGLKCKQTGWVREMLMLAQQSGIGAIGARILFDNHRVRHAGLSLGSGKQHVAGRLFFRTPEDEPGYFGSLTIVQNVSAVSAECLMVSRKKYALAGGFSESYQSCLFDVDFCLKLSELQYRNLYCPYSEFIGGKSRSFSADYGKEQKEYPRDSEILRNHWAKQLNSPDPFFSYNRQRFRRL